MTFNSEEIDLLRQWFNALEDVMPEFLEPADYTLAQRIALHLGTRLPSPRRTP